MVFCRRITLQFVFWGRKRYEKVLFILCFKTHFQGIVLTTESVLAYPIHLWLVFGHLAEAESEACSKYPDFAKVISDIILSLMGQKGSFSHKQFEGAVE